MHLFKLGFLNASLGSTLNQFWLQKGQKCTLKFCLVGATSQFRRKNFPKKTQTCHCSATLQKMVIIQECSASHNWNIGTVFRELARWNILPLNFQPFSLESTPKENFQGGVEGSKRGSCRVEPERRGTEPSLLSCLHLTNLGRVRLSCFNNAEE